MKQQSPSSNRLINSQKYSRLNSSQRTPGFSRVSKGKLEEKGVEIARSDSGKHFHPETRAKHLSTQPRQFPRSWSEISPAFFASAKRRKRSLRSQLGGEGRDWELTAAQRDSGTLSGGSRSCSLSRIAASIETRGQRRPLCAPWNVWQSFEPASPLPFRSICSFIYPYRDRASIWPAFSLADIENKKENCFHLAGIRPDLSSPRYF